MSIKDGVSSMSTHYNTDLKAVLPPMQLLKTRWRGRPATGAAFLLARLAAWAHLAPTRPNILFCILALTDQYGKLLRHSSPYSDSMTIDDYRSVATVTVLHCHGKLWRSTANGQLSCHCENMLLLINTATPVMIASQNNSLGTRLLQPAVDNAYCAHGVTQHWDPGQTDEHYTSHIQAAIAQQICRILSKLYIILTSYSTPLYC